MQSHHRAAQASLSYPPRGHPGPLLGLYSPKDPERIREGADLLKYTQLVLSSSRTRTQSSRWPSPPMFLQPCKEAFPHLLITQSLPSAPMNVQSSSQEHAPGTRTPSTPSAPSREKQSSLTALALTGTLQRRATGGSGGGKSSTRTAPSHVHL